MPLEIVEKHELTTGKPVVLLKSRKSALDEGDHYILQCEADGAGDGSAKPTPLTDLERAELYLMGERIARRLCEKNELGKDKFRLSLNGPGVCTRDHWHLHIQLPRGKDQLTRLVKKVVEVN